ncbi:MAG: DUF554 domain-containing protein [Odoribacteraceae bacterium]|jgi:uncharacterized membrane protein YqgA involved in biofilm formation|nr:DUF554 domain-containing protein [Odoribacteraceae bacterium]
MIGTVVNAGAIIVGSLAGVLLHSRLPRAIAGTLFQAMGLITIAVAIPMTMHPDNFPIVVAALAAGAVLGQWVDLDGRVRRLSARFQRPDCGASGRFAEGFVTASMLFCVGSMAILGPIEEGTGQPPVLLYTKSVMDGIAAMLFASLFGYPVLFSFVPVLLYQGSLTLFATFMMRFASEAMIADLTSSGGILLLGLGITILEIKEIRVINMLPALPLVVILSCLARLWG